MGSVSLKIGEGTARFKKPTICSSPTNILMLFSVITTNLFALYAFKYSHKPHNHHFLPHHHHHNHTHKTISLISEQVFFILKEIDSSQKKLTQIEKNLLGFESIDLSTPNIPKELKLFLKRHQLPLGKDSRTGITEMVSSVGHSCVKSIDLLSEFMNYNINGVCPDDFDLSQKLILRGCEPLPRRRCLSKILNIKKLNGGCFDLVKGYESQRFLKPRGKNDFLVDEVLALGRKGGIRIGFDIGGGCGTFAAKMAEKNVTIITTTSNMDAHFSKFIASRGLFPLYLSLDHRFPFYENIFDIVRAGNGLDFGGDRLEKSKLEFEFLMFDVDRIMRPGGLLWLDNFLCTNEENRRNLMHLVEVFGYKKHKWVVGKKVNGSGKSDVYLSAVLQKPVRG